MKISFFLILAFTCSSWATFDGVTLQCTGFEQNVCFALGDSRGIAITEQAEKFVVAAAGGTHTPGNTRRKLVEPGKYGGLRALKNVDAEAEHHRELGYRYCSNIYFCMFFGGRRRALLDLPPIGKVDDSVPTNTHGKRQLSSNKSSGYSINPDKSCRLSGGGTGVQGTDYILSSANSITECETDCTDNDDCKAYQFKSGNCHLWEDLPGELTSQSGSECNLKATTTENHNLGQLLSTYTLTTAEEACLTSISCDVTWVHPYEDLGANPVCAPVLAQLDRGGSLSMNFAEAQAFAPDGCHLAPVRDEAHFANVQAAVAQNSQCWVGIKKDNPVAYETSGWYNVYDNSGVPDTQNIWRSGEPNNSGSTPQTVASVNYNGSMKLRDVKESDTLRCGIYECCGTDISPNQYVKVSASMNFAGAQTSAPSGCYLAPIRTIFEQSLAAGAAGYEECFVGIRKDVSAGDPASIAGWYNINDNSPVPEVQNLWKTGEPNNSSGAQTVASINRGNSFKLRDVQETDSLNCAIYYCP